MSMNSRAPVILSGLVAAIMIAMTASEAAAKGGERWVAPGGDDAGPGTRERPWRTLAKAAAGAGPGTTVWLASGTWRERLIPTRSGTAAAPILFAAAPGATPVIDGKDLRLDGDFAGIVHIDNLSWIEVRGITVRNAGPGELAAGILARRCGHVTVRGCRTDATNSSGIGIWFSTSVLVEGNEVTDACRNGSQECITVAGCEGYEIAGNTVHDCVNGDHGGEGIDAKHGSHGKVHGNVVHHIRRVGIYVDAWDVEMHDVEVWGNLVHDTQANGYALAAENNGSLVGVRFHDNVAFRNAHAGLTLADWGEKTPHHGLRDIVVERSTFVENGTSGWGGGLRIDNAEAEGVVVRDNLFANNKGGQILVDKKPRSLSVDHNFVTGPGTDENETLGERPVRGVPRYHPTPDGGVALDPGSPGEGFGARAAESPRAAGSSVAEPPKGTSTWVYGYSDGIARQVGRFNAAARPDLKFRYFFAWAGSVSFTTAFTDSGGTKYASSYSRENVARYARSLPPGIRQLPIVDGRNEGGIFDGFTEDEYRRMAEAVARPVLEDPDAAGIHIDIEPFRAAQMPFYRHLKRILNAGGKVTSMFVGFVNDETMTRIFEACDIVVLSGYDIGCEGDLACYRKELEKGVARAQRIAEKTGRHYLVGIPAGASWGEYEYTGGNGCPRKATGVRQEDYVQAATAVVCAQLGRPQCLGVSLWGMSDPDKDRDDPATDKCPKSSWRYVDGCCKHPTVIRDGIWKLLEDYCR